MARRNYGIGNLLNGRIMREWVSRKAGHFPYFADQAYTNIGEVQYIKFGDNYGLDMAYLGAAIIDPLHGPQAIHLQYGVSQDFAVVENLDQDGNDYSMVGGEVTKNDYLFAGYCFVKSYLSYSQQSHKIESIEIPLNDQSKTAVERISQGSGNTSGRGYRVELASDTAEKLLDLPEAWAILLAYVSTPSNFKGMLRQIQVKQIGQDEDDDNLYPQSIEILFI